MPCETSERRTLGVCISVSPRAAEIATRVPDRGSEIRFRILPDFENGGTICRRQMTELRGRVLSLEHFVQPPVYVILYDLRQRVERCGINQVAERIKDLRIDLRI